MTDEPGPTGNFPLGRLRPDDDGELNVIGGVNQDGIIELRFGVAVTWMGMTPDDAEQMAQALLGFAAEARRHPRWLP